MTFVLALALCAGVVWIWNRLFDPIPLRLAAAMGIIVALYQAPSLFTARVDFPAHLAFAADPWKALGHPPATANTGIILTQIGPWTRVAAGAIRSGEWPLWNRYSESGSPLLANQQTAIFHPFTLIGFLLLDTGEAFTFTASVRLFFLLFFTYALLAGHGLRAPAALFGAVAYAFCTFHIIWLLFPLGLATMMLPLTMTGAQWWVREGRLRDFVLLTCGLTLSVLGGHPESAFWVWVTAAAYLLFLALAQRQWRRLPLASGAFLLAAGLSAFFWMPTVELLPRVERWTLMRSPLTNPAAHGLGREWLDLLVAPNLLGTPQSGSWSGPRTRHPAVLDDYGEIASGYAGIITLALAAAAILSVRRREKWFFAGLMMLSFLTVAEVPVWRDLIRLIPFAGVTLHQRLRVLWALGACALAAFALHEPHRLLHRGAALLTLALIVLIHIDAAPQTTVAWIAFAVAGSAALALVLFPERALLLAGITLAELVLITRGYNPTSPRDLVYPRTGAIAVMQEQASPARMAAVGWSFLPDTPAAYAIEDVKTTNPISNPPYTRLLRGFLQIPPSYDLLIGDLSQPFCDFLNIRWLYFPSDAKSHDPSHKLRYAGRDGLVYENGEVLPRYFLVPRFAADASFDRTIPRLIAIRDFAAEAIVDHLPDKVARAAPHLRAAREGDWIDTGGGSVRLLRYQNNRTTLDVESRGWNLLVSSDNHWPGWRVYIDGERHPPVTVNGAFLGAFVPPGQSRVQFRYAPPAFERGLRISAASLLLLMLLPLLSRAGARRRPAHPPHS